MTDFEKQVYHQCLIEGDLPPYQHEHTTLQKVDVDVESYRKLAAIRKDMISFVEAHKNLYICSSNVGNGKTTWAKNMMLAYTQQAIEKYGVGRYIMDEPPCVFVHVPTFLLRMKDFENGSLSASYKRKLLNADLVIWDDIAVGKNSNYDVQQLILYIDNRLFNGKSNIFTSNVTTVEELSATMDARLASRILESSTQIQFLATDARSNFKN